MNTFTTSVTPEQAAAWLQQNEHNRPLKKGVIEVYANAMRRGEWLLTGESIKFGGGRLLDGQHRLAACVASGTSFTSLVIEDMDPAVFAVLDTGAKRTTGDALHIAGVAGGAKLAAIANTLVMIRTGWSSPRATSNFTRQQVMKFVETNEERLAVADDRGRQVSVAIGLARSWWGAVMFDLAGQFDGIVSPLVLGAIDVHTADPEAFTNALVTGVNLDEGDPALALRGWVVRSVVARTHRTHQEFGSVVSNVLLAIHQDRNLARVGGHRWSRENATWIRTDLEDFPS